MMKQCTRMRSQATVGGPYDPQMTSWMYLYISRGDESGRARLKVVLLFGGGYDYMILDILNLTGGLKTVQLLGFQ